MYLRMYRINFVQEARKRQSDMDGIKRREKTIERERDVIYNVMHVRRLSSSIRSFSHTIQLK